MWSMGLMLKNLILCHVNFLYTEQVTVRAFKPFYTIYKVYRYHKTRRICFVCIYHFIFFIQVESLKTFSKPSAREDWCKQGETYFRKKRYDVAAEYFRNGSDIYKAQLAQAYHEKQQARYSIP